MSKLPKEKELWLIHKKERDIDLSRIVLIYSVKESNLTEVLLCNSDRSLATSTTVLLDQESADLSYSLGINLDIME